MTATTGDATPSRNPDTSTVGVSRNPAPGSGRCEECGAPITGPSVGRPARFCGDTCRQRAHRRRRGQPARLAPEPYWSDPSAAIHVGDARTVLDALPSGSVQTIVTSPPYYQLRDYGHPDQIGLEPTVPEYVTALVDTINAAWRVLRDDGTLWLNLGDTYSGRADIGKTRRHTGRGHREGITAARGNTVTTAARKSLLMIPARVAIALTDAGWILRNDIAWYKPNAMPESVTDRLSNRHEHIYLLSKNPSYVFNMDAIKVTATGRRGGNRDRAAYANAIGGDAAARRYGANPASTLATKRFDTHNPGDVWSISTRPSKVEHYAMMPPDIPLRCITASTAPGDLVLDPFAGAGTTGIAAKALGRRFLGIELVQTSADHAVTALSAMLPFTGDLDVAVHDVGDSWG